MALGILIQVLTADFGGTHTLKENRDYNLETQVQESPESSRGKRTLNFERE